MYSIPLSMSPSTKHVSDVGSDIIPCQQHLPERCKKVVENFYRQERKLLSLSFVLANSQFLH